MWRPEGQGQSKKSVFLPISRKVSQLGYMLLYKLYINLAIVVIIRLFSSLSDLSIKICPIRKENLFLAQILENKPLKVSVAS